MTNPTEAMAAETEQPISVVVGERYCIECGYNLIGQPIWRDAQYRMFIVRCPECATVASVQEYPLLGRWAKRWAMVLAGLWLLALLGALAASGGVLYGAAAAVAYSGSGEYAQYLQGHQATWMSAQDPDQLQSAGRYFGPSSVYQSIEQQWWSSVDPDELLRQAGGWRGAFDFNALRQFVWIAPTVFAIGIFWAVALLHLRKWLLAIVGSAPVGLAGIFLLLHIVNTDPEANIWWFSVYDAASYQLAPTTMLMMLIILFLLMQVGLTFGRPFTRLLARALLPPRLRGGLAFLWIADGRALPRVKGKHPNR